MPAGNDIRGRPMIRFILKAGFFLGLVALVLPRPDDGTPAAETQFDVFTAVMGAQAAVADLAGFCDRAPSACDAGGAIARFAGERIGDGLALAYGFVEGDVPGPQAPRPDATVTTAAAAPAAAPAAKDHLATGTIVRDAPLAMPPVEQVSASRPVKLPDAEIGGAAGALPIPRPAPRA